MRENSEVVIIYPDIYTINTGYWSSLLQLLAFRPGSPNLLSSMVIYAVKATIWFDDLHIWHGHVPYIYIHILCIYIYVYMCIYIYIYMCYIYIYTCVIYIYIYIHMIHMLFIYIYMLFSLIFSTSPINHGKKWGMKSHGPMGSVSYNDK